MVEPIMPKPLEMPKEQLPLMVGKMPEQPVVPTCEEDNSNCTVVYSGDFATVTHESGKIEHLMTMDYEHVWVGGIYDRSNPNAEDELDLTAVYVYEYSGDEGHKMGADYNGDFDTDSGNMDLSITDSDGDGFANKAVFISPYEDLEKHWIDDDEDGRIETMYLVKDGETFIYQDTDKNGQADVMYEEVDAEKNIYRTWKDTDGDGLLDFASTEAGEDAQVVEVQEGDSIYTYEYNTDGSLKAMHLWSFDKLSGEWSYSGALEEKE